MKTCTTNKSIAPNVISCRTRKSLLIGLSSCLVLLAPSARAEDTSGVARLERQLLQLQQRFEEMQAAQQREIESLKSQLRAVTEKDVVASEQQKLTDQLAVELNANRVGESVAAPVTVAPNQPIQLARAGSGYMNISFSSTMDGGWSTESKPSEQLELGDHDPQKRGFSLRNAEIALDGAVDPYFKGFANIVFKLDENDETEVELEESYLQTTALPANLQAKAGQFYANFGRQNPQHPHQWAFVDQPLVLNRAFGPDGLRNIGTQLSWLVPTPFYSELFLGVLDSQGGTAFSFRNEGDENEEGIPTFHGRATEVGELRGLGDLLFTPRLAASFDVTDTQTLLTGISGAFGPNATGSGNATQIYGADLYWKWKPENASAGFPFVAFQTEGLYSNFEAGEDPGTAPPLPAETLRDYGFYSQLLWGFAPRWVIGLRADYVDGNTGEFDPFDNIRGERFRLSPVLTFYPSEFSKLRFQYNYDQGEFISDANSFWMQLEFQLGSHAAHRY